MTSNVELSRRTWIAAVKLAAVISVVAAVVAIVVSSIGDVSHATIVAPVIIVAFIASWVQTGRVLRSQVAIPVVRPTR